MLSNRLKMSIVLAILSVLIVPLLAACGGGPSSVDVTLTEDYQIELSTDEAKAGEITFNITNEATELEHEFVVVKSDLAAADQPTDEEGIVPEDQIDLIDEQEALFPGDSGELTLDLEPGHYVLMCNLPGHYTEGMYADFTVN